MTALLHMLPPLAVDDLRYCLSANAKFGSDVLMPNSHCGKGADFSHVAFCQLCRARPLAASLNVKAFANRVAAIFRSGNPFKIFRSVISLVPILVIYLRQAGGIRQKRLSHDPVGKLSSLFSIHVKWLGYVAIGLRTRFHQPSFDWLVRSPSTFDDAVNRPDSTKIGNLVDALIPRDVFPFFKHFNTLALGPDIIRGYNFRQAKAVLR